MYRVVVRDPRAHRLLTIERLTLVELLLDWRELDRLGWLMVGDPHAVAIDEQEVVACV